MHHNKENSNICSGDSWDGVVVQCKKKINCFNIV